MSKDSNSARKVESPWQDSTVIFRLFLCQRELIPLEEWKARNFSTFPMPETTNSARKSGKPVTAALMVLVFRYCNISTFPFANGWGSTVIFRLFLCQRQLIPLEKWKARGNRKPVASKRPCFSAVKTARAANARSATAAAARSATARWARSASGSNFVIISNHCKWQQPDLETAAHCICICFKMFLFVGVWNKYFIFHYPSFGEGQRSCELASYLSFQKKINIKWNKKR